MKSMTDVFGRTGAALQSIIDEYTVLAPSGAATDSHLLPAEAVLLWLQRYTIASLATPWVGDDSDFCIVCVMSATVGEEGECGHSAAFLLPDAKAYVLLTQLAVHYHQQVWQAAEAGHPSKIVMMLLFLTVPTQVVAAANPLLFM